MATTQPDTIMTHTYAGGLHDRAAVQRREAGWLDAAFLGDDTRFLPVWRDRHLVTDADGPAPMLGLLTRDALDLDPALAPAAFLGTRDGSAIFAIDISTLDEEALPGPFTSLRPVAALLPAPDAALAAQARSLLAWLGANRYCGRCGSANDSEDMGARLRCTAEPAHVVFPRVDPVVIVLVRDGARALVARGARFPPERRLFSALAGFVEPGESAEEAVAREVFEETGVRIHRIRYHSSQPWPYPGALMLGFTAEALNTELTLDPEEILEAQWITRAMARDPEAHGFTIPGPAAIAHHLITGWRDEDIALPDQE